MADRYVAIFHQLAITKAALGSAALFAIGVVLIALTFTALPDESGHSWVTFTLRSLGSGLMVGGVVSLAVYVFVRRNDDKFGDTLTSFVKRDVRRELEKIDGEIRRQTKKLIAASDSLEALHRCNVANVFESRGEAVNQIIADLLQPGISNIRLMGISLNNFVRSDQREGLHGAWNVIASYVRGERTVPGGKQLTIRVLVLDPNCFGAALRSFAETREQHTESLAGRLENDVTQTAEYLARLVELSRNSRESASPVSFDFRMYRLPPTLFICSAGEACYVQAYHFWSRRDPDVSLPLTKISTISPLGRGAENHFDVVWDNASTDGCEWVKAIGAGPPRGIHETAGVHVFSDDKQARRRMLWLLAGAQARVDVLGNSLQSFFSVGDLLNAIQELIDGGKVQIRVLLLDPESADARRRSFREFALSEAGGKPSMAYEDYVADPDRHRESELYQQTCRSLQRIRDQLAPRGGKLQVKLCESVPYFMLRVDNRVCVEQYHLGKVVPRGAQESGMVAILGKEMPLIEFTRGASTPLETERQRVGDADRGSPFGLLVDHFEFVFDHLASKALEPSPDGNAHHWHARSDNGPIQPGVVVAGNGDHPSE